MRSTRWLLLTATLLVALLACSPAAPQPAPSPSKAAVDYVALKAAIEDDIVTGSVALDNVRAVLVSVDGVTEISHYRHGFTAADPTHVWSVTKSVVATLIGIAIADGLIDNLDQTLGELLPQHRASMSAPVAGVTLRELMTMSAGFPTADPPYEKVKKMFAARDDLVAYLLKKGQTTDAGTQFIYSNTSSHLVAAVLTAALRRGDGDHPRTIAAYAREKLFDPLGIDTHPAFVEPLPDPAADEFVGFGWATDPQGIPFGGFGLRLSPPDLVKIGELYLNNGVWHGKQVITAEWVRQITTPSEIEPRYGLMWWLDSWNGHQVYFALGFEGQTVVVVPDQKSVIVIASANRQEYPMDDEALSPLLGETIIPALDGS